MTMPTTMRAWRMHDYGGEEVMHFEEAPVPAPGHGEVLVRVHAASINPVDWKIREGMLRGSFAVAFPRVPGRDCAGTVAALGALSVIVLAACYGTMTWTALVKSLEGALRVTVMAFLIIFGSATFAQVLAFTGASGGLMNWALSFDVTPIGMMFIMIGIILFLGCFMDQLSMMLLTAPIFFPLAKTLGFDLTWFGLIMLLALEIGFTTPPFGLLLFVMKGVAPPGTTMRDIYLAGMPFIACMMLLTLLIIFFPPLATWLPSLN